MLQLGYLAQNQEMRIPFKLLAIRATVVVADAYGIHKENTPRASIRCLHPGQSRQTPYVYMHAYMYVCVCMYVCRYVCMYVCM